MAKTQVTTPAPQSVAPASKEKKIDAAQRIFDRVMKMTPAELDNKTPRRVFMNLASVELGMGERGANTYFQNLKNEAEGKGRYPYSPSSKKPEVQTTDLEHASLGDVLAEVRQLGTKVTALNRQVNKIAKAQAHQQPSA